MRVAVLNRPARRGGAAGMGARGARSRIRTIPGPSGGWNARDALTDMEPNEAIELDNFIPDQVGVRLRHGYTNHVTAISGIVETLMEYNPPTGTVKLFGATTDSIYDVTTAGLAGSADVTGLANGRWQHVMFATSGGNFLVLANGADDVRNYNGTVFSSPSITGVTSSTLVNVAVHGSRLWFVQVDTLDAWYLPTSSISGAATKLPLGPLCKKGGSLLAIASWTRDGGAGMDDALVFITTKGEAVLYNGSDPASSQTFQRVGTFSIPEPVGRRCVVNIGSDLGLITSQGVLPFSAILPMAASGAGKVAATDKISKAFASAYAGASTAFGWQLIEYPKDRLLIVNVPTIPATTLHQYVMNTDTEKGSWCRFKNINASCWSLKGDELYFGTNGKVCKYGSVFSDNGEAINAVSISAYNDLGTVNNKQVKQARPMFRGVDGYLPGIAVRTDYDQGVINYTAAESETGGAAWDEAEWDVADWGIAIRNSSRWQSLSEKNGAVFSFALAANTQEQFQFNSVDLMIEDGGYL